MRASNKPQAHNDREMLKSTMEAKLCSWRSDYIRRDTTSQRDWTGCQNAAKPEINRNFW